MEHKPSEAQLFPWPLWPDLMVTKLCRALPRNWTVLLEQFSLQIARALISSPQMLRLVYPPMQAGSLLKPVGLPAHAGLHLGLSSPLHNAEKEWDSHPTDLHFEGEHSCWMISDGSLVPVITQTQSSKNNTTRPHDPIQSPKGINQGGANPGFSWVQSHGVPSLSPCVHPWGLPRAVRCSWALQGADVPRCFLTRDCRSSLGFWLAGSAS